MSDQNQLHLPHIPAPVASTAADANQRSRMSLAGFTLPQIAAGALILGATVWGMWVTKTLVTPRQDHIVSARLSAIVGDYVQAQARSATAPPQVEGEMRRFMAALDKEVQRRSDKGEIIVVGEAVLTKNVPDVTDSIKKAVYASGVRYPRQATAQDMPVMAHPAASVPFSAAAPAAPIAMTADDAVGSAFAPPATRLEPVPALGGYDGANGQ